MFQSMSRKGNEIWSNCTPERSQMSGLSNYMGKELEITQKIVLEDKIEWMELSVDNKVIGWIEIEIVK